MTRLMCSRNRNEVELVKKELFRAGIRSEIRSNPVADALRVTRLELWVEDERDFLNASKLYAGLQGHTPEESAAPTPASDGEAPGVYIDVNEPDDETGGPRHRRGNSSKSARRGESQNGGLEQASSLLEKEIEEMLERESELARTCSSLRSKVKELSDSLAQAQAELARATESRAAAERKQAAEVSDLQSALGREQAERARAKEQLEHDTRELKQQLKARDEALKEAQTKLDTRNQQFQAQQAAVVELRKEIVSREQQWNEHEKLLSKARAGAEAERETRIAAEERAEAAVAAQQSLEKQLSEQKELQRQVQAYTASLNSLRSKLQAKRALRLESER